MKKTALTMTDSEKLGAEILPEVSDPPPKTPQEENRALRVIVEQQEIAMDMMMRKYREHVDSLTRVSRLDVRKLFYKRYLDVIVNQATKMDGMTKTMRRNLSIIYKYEEVMKQIEAENEELRSLVKRLTVSVQRAKKGDERKPTKNDVASQTDFSTATTDKSVGTECEDLPESGKETSEKRDNCTDMIPYTPFFDRFVYFGTAHTLRPPTAPLDVDAAFDLYVNRFTEETKKPALESSILSTVTSTETDADSPSELDVSEDSSEDLASSTRALLTDGDELSSEISIVSLLMDDGCSNENPPDCI